MKVLIADDHSLIRSGLADLLSGMGSNVSIVTASSGGEALQLAKDHAPIELAVLDLFMQDMDGFTFLRRFCNQHPQTPAIVMSASTNRTHIRRAFDCGVSGYLPKAVDKSVFIDAIERVVNGGVYTPDEAILGQEEFDNTVRNAEGKAYSQDEARQALTDRQLEILERIRLGKSNKHIAREFGLSENTVKTHVSAILQALGLSNRTEAGIFAEKLDI